MPPPHGGLLVAAVDMQPHSHGGTLSTNVAQQQMIFFHPEITINESYSHSHMQMQYANSANKI